MQRLLKSLFDFIKRHSTAVRVIVVVLLFWIVLRNIQPGQIVRAFAGADGRFLFAAAALMLPNLLLQVAKWHFILRTMNPKPSLAAAVYSVLGGFFLGAASPGRTGEYARGLLMPGCSKVRIASLTVLDKGFNQVVVVIAGLVSLSFLLPRPYSFIPIAAEVFFIAALINLHRLRPVLERLVNVFSQTKHVDNALAAFDALSPATIFGMTLYSVGFYLVYAVQYYLMIRAFTYAPADVAAKTLPVIYLVNLLLPVSFGDFGIKELTAVSLFSSFTIPGGAAFSATLTSNVMTFLLPSMAGGIMIALWRPRRVEEARSSDGQTAPLSDSSHRRAVSETS